jgi:hypothetical protein
VKNQIPQIGDTAVVSVASNAATIVANDDAGNPSSGWNGGTTVTDVLLNDNLNGAAVLASQYYLVSSPMLNNLSGNLRPGSGGTPVALIP